MYYFIFLTVFLYKITIKFLTLILYKIHTPKVSGRVLKVPRFRIYLFRDVCINLYT